jgi:isoamylase/glycogen operon protein
MPVLYGYRIDGSQNNPTYFNPKHLVLDPYAKLLKVKHEYGHKNQEYKPRGLLQEVPWFDWEGVQSPSYPVKDLIIYEMHVRGFTKDFSSQTLHPGTFLGVIEKIPYLLDLGVNAIELMPIQEFNECGNDRKNPKTQEPLSNYWGYSPLHYFFPMMRYAQGHHPLDALIEFKTMVRELHRSGIEVLLDVVFNHTGEKKNQTESLSFLGIDRPNYYLLEKGLDTNFTGCGNTLNCNHPVMQQFLIDCMRYFF